MKPIGLFVFAALALVWAVGTAAGFAAPAVPPNPGGFAPRVANPWFPLRPGTIDLYRGIKDGQPSRDVFRVTRKTKVIQGVRCTVILDRLYLHGRLEERTHDWYAQDKVGNVWYFGEATVELNPDGSTPGAVSNTALLTREWSPLEPGTVDHKLYVRGIGTVVEQTVKGGDERNTLIAVKHQ